ncbi:MAG: thioredoxin domain-containing protein [Candidatus Hydrogenedentes bacterium]|nr:thioredoxin domain-containing protein [Candidatus Hydrogenedentota bacterium]
MAAAATEPALPSPEVIAALPSDGGPQYNRLIFEKSPYLLQHASNPVDWYPWGAAAFEKARAEDKPIFLSIGYSTCHWCHVMERESFQDTEVAALMNDLFVNIKVDREERPDIDHLFMSASIATRGSGGWPQTVLMTADVQPFFLASYLPRESRPGRLGLIQLFEQTREYWHENRDGIKALTDEIGAKLRDFAANPPGRALDADTLTAAFNQLSERFDPEYGGLERAQKFPTTHHLSFLLRYWKRSGDPHALAMVEQTLDAMHNGGIYDHLGGGFHRYAIDREWKVPHFEKMLYDQAMLAITYLEAYQVTHKDDYAAVAREILDYVLRDLTSPEGGFYSARDADSPRGEGGTYVWTLDEIAAVLGEERGRVFARAYDFEEGGNYYDQATGEKTGYNIPRPVKNMKKLASELGLTSAELQDQLEDARKRLFEVRQEREQPALDDKILTDWNGLMIAALAKGGRTLAEPIYTEAAAKASAFISTKLRAADGNLLHRYRDGDAAITAQLDDYAYLVWGLLELYEADFDVQSLESAIRLNHRMIDQFWDPAEGGFFLTARGQSELPLRLKEPRDGARPAGNSVAALNLLRIGRITGDEELEKKAEMLFKAFERKVRSTPSGFTQLLIALDFAVGPAYEVVISGRPGAEDTQRMLGLLRRSFTPNAVVLFRPAGPDTPPISKIAEFTQPQIALDGRATAYVCKNYVCNTPTTNARVMLDLLAGPP